MRLRLHSFSSSTVQKHADLHLFVQIDRVVDDLEAAHR